MAFSKLLVTVLSIIIYTLCFYSSISEGRLTSRNYNSLLSQTSSHHEDDYDEGNKWAVLVAGSSGYDNYRHQADICHAYQTLKKRGMKDENIIVFMYDDIAYNSENPNQGVIINHPNGTNVYPGVPKDYTGEAVNSANLYAVLLGDENGVKGGSGKVLKTGPKDHIFFYYADHGAYGILGMPSDEDYIYADDLINVLKKKHDSKSYAKMVIYIEACEAGSMFDGLLPDNWNIYAVTASNKDEFSYATYCSDYTPDPCLGDLFSVSWLENSDTHTATKESLHQQYVRVKHRVSYRHAKDESSHVSQFGDKNMSNDYLGNYWIPNFSRSFHKSAHHEYTGSQLFTRPITDLSLVNQRDAELRYFENKVKATSMESKERVQAQKQLDEVISHRNHVDQSVEAIVNAMFSGDVKTSLLDGSRPLGQPIVDDWDCLKSMVNTYEKFCGSLKAYGLKHVRAFANMCNAGVRQEKMSTVTSQICGSK